MPITDRTSKALLNFSRGKEGQLLPTFPSFLPLEIFDNTEFDCRTPEEWLALGKWYQQGCSQGVFFTEALAEFQHVNCMIV